MAEPDLRRWLLPVVGVAALLVLAVPLWLLSMGGPIAGGGMHGGHMMGSQMGSTVAWSGLAVFVWAVSALVLVGGSVLVLSAVGDEPSSEASGQNAEADPIATLRQRYVNGELSEAEFERRVERLLESSDGDIDGERVLATERGFRTE